MYKKKSLFITFEGIEGSGKSFQAQKLYKNLRRQKISSILTREPGGTPSAEKIREVILKDYFHSESIEKFKKYTDTLLYLAARNEHVENKIRPAIKKKKIIICDRFIEMYVSSKGILTAELSSATELGEVDLSLVKKYIQESAGSKVNLITKLDSSILGGYILKIGSLMLDGSIRSKLQGLKISMRKG